MKYPMFPDAPANKKELLARVMSLVTGGVAYQIPTDKEYGCGGSGGPGHYMEMLVGSQGKNHAFADTIGIELKFKQAKKGKKGSGCLTTLFHLDSVGGVDALLPLVKKLGRLDKEGRLSFRHTVNAKSKFVVVRADKKISVVNPVAGLSVYWLDRDLLNSAARKLNFVILVTGKVDKTGLDRFVTFEDAFTMTNFESDEFLSYIGKQIVVFDFDAREDEPGSNVLRNHGTKLRMRPRDYPLIWSKIRPIASSEEVDTSFPAPSSPSAAHDAIVSEESASVIVRPRPMSALTAFLAKHRKTT